MKKRLCIIFIFLLSVIVTEKIHAQLLVREIVTNVYFSPFITIGYTFNTGINYGLDFTFGLIKVRNKRPEINAALSLQYYFVNYEKNQHIIKTVNIVIESENYRLGFGAGEIKKSWGFNNRNVTRAFGRSLDFGLSGFSTQVPWLGVKEFLPKKGTWEWCKNKNYISMYTYFRQDPIYLFSQ